MEVPAALTEAVKEGKIDKLIDYYKLQNIQADTEMRRRLGGKFTNPENKNFDDDFDDDFDDEFFEDEETAGTKDSEAKDKKEDSDEETEE